MRRPFSQRKQRGAALVIGLVLLAILTLLAITGMNTSTTELIMAGNEQFRQNAFQAAETGRENALKLLSAIPTDGSVTTVPETPVPAGSKEKYTTTSQYIGQDQDIAGYRAGAFVGNHYIITSTGRSSRNAEANHEQGAFVVASSGNADGGGTPGDAGKPVIPPDSGGGGTGGGGVIDLTLE
jgi:type IV pilus assembly protein PilX